MSIAVKGIAEEEQMPTIWKFTVTDPNNQGNHTKYTFFGSDRDGKEFKVQRRFREFLALGQILKERWPSCYVPYFPQKTIINRQSNKIFE